MQNCSAQGMRCDGRQAAHKGQSIHRQVSKRHLLSRSHGQWGLCVQTAVPAKPTFPAKLGPVTAINLQQNDAHCTQQSLASLWGLCKIKTGTIMVQCICWVNMYNSALTWSCLRVSPGFKSLSRLEPFSFISLGAGSAWQAISQ